MFRSHAKYAFPGGFEINYITEDNALLCSHCAMVKQEETTLFMYWEGPTTYCDNCNKNIESIYGEPEPPKCQYEESTDELIEAMLDYHAYYDC